MSSRSTYAKRTTCRRSISQRARRSSLHRIPVKRRRITGLTTTCRRLSLHVLVLLDRDGLLLEHLPRMVARTDLVGARRSSRWIRVTFLFTRDIISLVQQGREVNNGTFWLLRRPPRSHFL